MNKNFSISHVTKRRALQGPKTPPSFMYLTETFTRQTIIRENVFSGYWTFRIWKTKIVRQNGIQLNIIRLNVREALSFHYLSFRLFNFSFICSCPGHFRADCEAMKQYLFYIVLENSKCKEYITEKLFNHAYSRGSIPIIQGPSIKDCERLLPPNSYLHLDNYATIRDLVKDIKDITENNEKLASFHMWRYNFEVRNEHGFFGSKSYHLCRLCEAMNYNDKTKSAYSEEDLKRFLDSTTLCRN